MNDKIYFGLRLSLDDHQKLKVVSEYNKRSMSKWFSHIIGVEYEEMKRNLK